MDRGSFSARGKAAILAIVGCLAILGPAQKAEATSIIEVAGTTLGCFGTGCSIFTGPVYSGATNDLTFTGTAFDVFTNASGAASGFSLGSFGRGNTNVSSSTPSLDFKLQVTFTIPVGIGGSPATFTAIITGTTPGGGGAEDVNFDNTFQSFAYSNASGSGSFDFRVSNDPQVLKNTLSNPVLVLGQIQNATFTPAAPPTTPVPEPASLMLIGSGLSVLAYRARRRRKG